VGNLPSTLLEDFVITTMLTSGVDAGCCVIKDCVITVTSGGDGHVWACSILGEGPVLTQTQAPPQKMSVTDTGSSPKSLLFYYIWIGK
jgi:hypothetical protein